MKKRRIHLLLTWFVTSISLLLLTTTTYGVGVIIGGDSIDMGTIIFVSPNPGDTATANGTALRNTLNGISDNSSSAVYLIKLGPGTYDIGANCLLMKPYVSIEGSGEKATKITASGSSGTINTTDNVELRSLTVENTNNSVSLAIANGGSPSLIHVTATVSAGTSNTGIYNYNSSPNMTFVTVTVSGGASTANIGIDNLDSSPTMTNVTATVLGGTSSNNFGIRSNNSSSTMTNVTASASGGLFTAAFNWGIENISSSATMTNVTASATAGTSNFGVANGTSGTIRINNSVIKGSTNTIYNSTGATTRVANTQLDGGAVSNTGTLTCAGVYDENYVFSANTCP